MKILVIVAVFAITAASAIAQPPGAGADAAKAEEANNAIVTLQPQAAKAVSEGRLDEAVDLFRKILGYVPGDPSTLNNLAVVHMRRAAARSKASTGNKLPDGAVADLREAARYSAESVANAAKQPGTPRSSVTQYRATHAEAMRLVASRVDRTQADAAAAAYKEYLAAEQNASAKASAQRNLALMLYDLESFQRAIPEFEAVLAAFPADYDLLFGYAASIAFAEDKTRHQKAADSLKRFLEIAPTNHAQRPSAQELLELLKAEGVTPK